MNELGKRNKQVKEVCESNPPLKKQKLNNTTCDTILNENSSNSDSDSTYTLNKQNIHIKNQDATTNLDFGENIANCHSYASMTFGFYYTLSIAENGNVLSCGNNMHGVLGFDPDKEKYIYFFKQIQGLKNIKMISTNTSYTICVDFDGSCFIFGRYAFKQLGLEKNGIIHYPQQIPNIPPINIVASGYHFTICITFDYTLYSFGVNSKGQLGLGHYEDSFTPKLIPDIENISFVECGREFVYCKSFSEEIYFWGNNGDNIHGISGAISVHSPIKCTDIPENTVSIKCGGNTTLFLTSNGYVYVRGEYNNFIYYGAPEIIKNIPLIKQIECGISSQMFIDINDKLWLAGTILEEYDDFETPTLIESVSNPVIDISSGGHNVAVRTNLDEVILFGDREFIGLEDEKEDAIISNWWKLRTPLWKSKQKSARK